jgi:hypothetical protein
MSKLLEVRANVSFGSFRALKVYEVDLEEDMIMALIGVGYLTPTCDEEIDDDRESAGLVLRSDPRSADLHGIRVVGSAEPAERLDDVEDRAEPGSDTSDSKTNRLRRRKAIDGESVAGGEEPR